MGLHEGGHVRHSGLRAARPDVWQREYCCLWNRKWNRRGRVKKNNNKKKRVCFIRCSAAKWPSVPAASSQRGQAVRDAGEMTRSLEWAADRGSSCPQLSVNPSLSGFQKLWETPRIGACCLTQRIPVNHRETSNCKAHDSILTPVPWLQAHYFCRSPERHQVNGLWQS